MTVLDLVVIALIALSVLFAYWRGMVREVVALAAWIVGLVAAFRYMIAKPTVRRASRATSAVTSGSRISSDTRRGW